MKLFRISVVILTGCVVLAGMGAVRSSRAAKGRQALLENSFVPVGGEDDLSGALIKTPEYNPGIYYEGTLLPYDKEDGRLYLPLNHEGAEWYGKLAAVIDGEDYPVYILRGDMDNMAEMEKRREAVRESRDFTIYVPVSESEYCKFLLTITGMPLISMATEYGVEAEDIPYEEDPDKKVYGSEKRYYGRFLMIDPGARSGQYQITEAAVCYHYKGAVAGIFEKSSYSVDLLDYRGEKVDVSLAGMRSASKWKLNSLYTDENRIREITASQIWELIDEANDDLNESGPNMEYVELIVDNDYKGVYCLVEPIDAGKLGLRQEDVLYKKINEEIPGRESIQESVDMGWRIQYPVRIRYPKEIKDYRAAWYPIDDYLEMFYRGGEFRYEDAAGHIDLDNFCDMAIFTMAVSGSDNFHKNTYYAAECGDGFRNYRMKLIPWDLDYTFGNVYRETAEKYVGFDDDCRKVYVEDALLRLYEENPEEIAARLNERWKRYRSGFLSEESIIALLEGNREYLLETGAFVREKERWPQGGVNLDIDYLKEFQAGRMEWLDGYFASW